MMAGYAAPAAPARATKSSKNLAGGKRALPSNLKIDEQGKPRLAIPRKSRIDILPPANDNTARFTPEAIEELLEEGNLSDEFGPEKYTETDIRPGNRIVRTTSEAAKFRRMQVHRLLLRGVPRSTIAQHLGISMDNLYADVKIITGELREEMRSMDYTMYIGMSMSFYDECRNIALRLATDNKEKSNGVKMAALRTAIAAEDAKHSFFARVGLFKVVSPTDPFNSIQTGRQGSYSDENDINLFMQSIASAARGETLLALGPREVVDADPGGN